jgi:methionyl-tRNA synthetase
VDLRVATVIKAEKIPRAKKLLKLEVDMGEARTIVAGIANDYEPEDIVGKQVIVVANLKPAKLMGILSNGMVLAAVEDGKCSIATLDKEVKPGTSLR